MGFHEQELQKLHGMLVQIGTKCGIKAREAVSKFFTDLEGYDAMAGFQREIQRLGTVAETRRLETEKLQAEKDKVEREYRTLKEAIVALQSLLKQGVSAAQVLAWHRVPASVDGVEELPKGLNRYKSMAEALAANRKEIESVKVKREQLAAEVAALSDKKTESTAAIQTLPSSGVAEIAAVRDRAISSVTDLIDALRRDVASWGELKVEAGKLQKEFSHARCLTSDPRDMRTAPKEVADIFVTAAMIWCKSRSISRKIEAPKFLREKYFGLPSYEKYELVDIIWLTL